MQPCWTCLKYCGGCPWTNGFHPIPGWRAIPTIHTSGKTAIHSFDIQYCPLREPDGSREPEERGRKQAINKNRLGRYSLSPEEDRIRMDLYYRGLTDFEIAEALEVSKEAIRNWRHRRNLAPNQKRRKNDG